jgi:hypothetical protein
MLSRVATVGAQDMTNARLNITTPNPESDDYPTQSPIDQ